MNERADIALKELERVDDALAKLRFSQQENIRTLRNPDSPYAWGAQSDVLRVIEELQVTLAREQERIRAAGGGR